MILKLINSVFLSVILMTLAFPAQPFAQEREKSSNSITNYPEPSPPDLGNLSNFDNILDISSNNFAGDQKREFELYAFALVLRLNALRNILTVTKITRGLGKYLGISEQYLRSLPQCMFESFDRLRFPDLYKLIDSITSADFNLEENAFNEILQSLALKSGSILKAKKRVFEEEVLKKNEIKSRYTEKTPAAISIPLYLPYGSPHLLFYARNINIPLGFKHDDRIMGIQRTRELKGYARQMASTEGQIAKSREILNTMTEDLYLYLPFYDQNLFQKAWSSLRSDLKPSYTFGDLLVATVFFGSRPDIQMTRPEEFAKWLNSGIRDQKEYDRFLSFYDRTESLRKGMRRNDIPEAVSDPAASAFKKAVTESIKNQNKAIEMLSDQRNIVNPFPDTKSCHVKSRDHTKLPRQYSFLVELSDPRRQFLSTYGQGHYISQDKINLLGRELEIAYESLVKSKDRGWIVPLRIAVFTAAVLIPVGWIGLAIVAGYSLIDAGTAWGVSLKNQAETDVLKSLFDSTNLFAENSSDSQPLSRYRGIIDSDDSYKMQAYATTAEVPIYIALYMGLSRIANSTLAKRNAFAAKKFLSLSREPIAPVKASLVAASAALLISVQIKDVIGINEPDLILENTAASSYSDNILFNARSALIADHFENFKGMNDEIGLRSAFQKGSIEIKPYDLSETRIIDQDGKTRIHMNYKYFENEDTTLQNLIYEIAYYYYLHKTTDIIIRKGLTDDMYFRISRKAFVTGDKKDNPQGPMINQEAAALEEGIFLSAEEYAQRFGGVKDPLRQYLGAEFLTWNE